MKQNSDLKNSLIKSKMLSLGIIPYTNINENINIIVESSSSEEIRKMRRKFRKLWKKAQKRVNQNNLFLKSSSTKQYSSRSMHKKIVLEYIKAIYVDPILNNIHAMTTSK